MASSMRSSSVLTTRQETFARALARGDISATEAARRAGYRHPDRAAHRLRNVQKVRRLVAEIRNHVRDPAEALAEHLDHLADLRDTAIAIGNYAAAVRAEIARGRAAGFLDRRSRVEQPTPVPDSLELMERLAARLAEPGIRAIIRAALATYPD